MAIHRSPNYPALGLRNAVDAARQIYDKEKKTQVPSEIIAKALGYSSLSGNARVKIAALKKYGLLEGDESKGMRVSDLAIHILYPSSTGEALESKRAAALYPALFKSLYDEKREGSDEAIVNHLVSRLDFTPQGAKQAVESFRDTITFAELGEKSYNASGTPEQMEAQKMQAESRTAIQAEASAQLLADRVAKAPHSWTWPLSVPRGVNAQLMLTGQFVKADITRLKKQIEFLEESFDEEKP